MSTALGRGLLRRQRPSSRPGSSPSSLCGCRYFQPWAALATPATARPTAAFSYSRTASSWSRSASGRRALTRTSSGNDIGRRRSLGGGKASAALASEGNETALSGTPRGGGRQRGGGGGEADKDGELWLHNSKGQAPFVLPSPSKAGTLTWYSCGPTVYDSAHLGHARTYVSLDIVRRVLVRYFGYDVCMAMGVTDIDDKIIQRGAERGLTEWPQLAAMTRQLEDEFMTDMRSLGVLQPDALLRVTEHVPDIISYVERILALGKAYEASDGVYFDVGGLEKEKYGRLGIHGNEVEFRGSDEGEVAETGEGDDSSSSSGSSSSSTSGSSSSSSTTSRRKGGKRHHRDFALWKRTKEGEPCWSSPFGPGRPGWHIECSAMTHALFGSSMDIHSGGIDLLFPHHTNECAQCEAYNESEEWVGTWVHTGHLHIDGRKMSKSLKNFITVRAHLRQQARQRYLDAAAAAPTQEEGEEGGGGELGDTAGVQEATAAEELAAEDFRMFCLMHRYGASVTLSDGRMNEASHTRTRITTSLRAAAVSVKRLESTEGQSHGGLSPAEAVRGGRRWGEHERHLMRQLQKGKGAIRQSLQRNVDTPTVVQHMSELCNALDRYLREADGSVWGQHDGDDGNGAREGGGGSGQGGIVPDPVLAVTGYVEWLLRLLGLDRTASDACPDTSDHGGGVGVSGAGAMVGPTVEGAVQELLDFRAQVRERLLLAVKETRAHGQDKEEGETKGGARRRRKKSAGDVVSV